jgi:MATE family multidrug resistance protein
VSRRTGAFVRPQRPDWRQLWAFCRLGLPIGATVFVKFSIFTVLALMMASLGTATLAAHQVALNIAELAFMAPFSVGSALVIQVGQALGRGDPYEAQRVARSGVCLAVAIGALTGLCIFLGARPLATLYTNDPVVAARAASVLLLVAIQQLPETAQVSAGLALTSYKDTKVSFLAILIGYWFVCLPLGHTLGTTRYLGGPYGLEGYWVGLLAGLFVVASLQVGRLIVISRRALNRSGRDAARTPSVFADRS